MAKINNVSIENKLKINNEMAAMAIGEESQSANVVISIEEKMSIAELA
jgi:hypothetical protein